MPESTPQGHAGLKNRTKLVHAGRHPGEQLGFVNTPLYRSSTVLFPTTALGFWMSTFGSFAAA